MIETSQYNGILFRLKYPQGQEIHLYLHELIAPGLQFKLERMARFWGTPEFCEPNLRAARPRTNLRVGQPRQPESTEQK